MKNRTVKKRVGLWIGRYGLLAAGGAWLIANSTIASAETGTNSVPEADKSHYTLFNPVPSALLREMNTDRPDVTESPYTVDAGHYQIEMDLVNFTYDHNTADGADTTTHAWSIAPMNLKVGLCNQADLQLVLGTFNYISTDNAGPGSHTIQRGFGDIITRLKINFWGNDGGTTAFGVMPFAKFPTSQDQIGNNSVEGGIIFPLAIKLPGGWDMGTMAEFDFNRNGTDSNYHTEIVNSVTFDHDIVGKLAGYIEFVSIASTEANADWTGLADGGVTYAVTENIQLDAGCNFGVTASAPNYQPFVGLSVRF